MKKIVISVISVIGILFLVTRIYHFIVINQVYNAMMRFNEESNKYYSVTINDSDKNAISEIAFVKDNITKCCEQKNGTDLYCEWKNFDHKEKYEIDFKTKSFKKSTLAENQQSVLRNLPRLILNIYKDEKFIFYEFLKIKYVIPVKYQNQKCYKIVGNNDTCIVDRDNFLPIFYSVKFMKSEQSLEMENTYEFKIGEVTDEDVALPDLTEYINENEK